MRDRVSEGGGAVEREMKNQRLVTSWKDNVLAEWGGGRRLGLLEDETVP